MQASVFAQVENVTQLEDLKIEFVESNQNIPNSTIISVIETAKQEIEAEKKVTFNMSTKKSAESITYQYTLIGDDGNNYLYEDSKDGSSLLVYPQEITYSEKEDPQGIHFLKSHNGGFISDGVGGRQRIIQSGQYLSTSVKTAVESEIDEQQAAYTYIGFQSSSYVADAGLKYYSNRGATSDKKVWVPMLIVKKLVNNTWVSQDTIINPTYNEVQYKNGYVAIKSLIMCKFPQLDSVTSYGLLLL